MLLCIGYDIQIALATYLELSYKTLTLWHSHSVFHPRKLAYQQAVARHILQLHFALVLSRKQWKKGKDAEK